MRLLIDTHLLIWTDDAGAKLPAVMRVALTRYDEIAVSVASVWEAELKYRNGKLPLSMSPNVLAMALIDRGALLVSVTLAHVAYVLHDPPATRDPFDRMLLTQCEVEGMRLLTIDRDLANHRLAARA